MQRPIRAIARKAEWFMHNCQQFREHAGLNIAELSRLSGVSRDLIYKIEAGEPVKVEKLHAIANILDKHCTKPFSRDTEITKSPKKGKNAT